MTNPSQQSANTWSVRELWCNPNARRHLILSVLWWEGIGVLGWAVPTTTAVAFVMAIMGFSSGVSLVAAVVESQRPFLVAAVAQETARRVYADLLSRR